MFPISCDEEILSRNSAREVLRLRAINTRVESGKATVRIEPDGYKKKLLASQTHLDLRTVPRALFPFFLSFSVSLFFSSFFVLPSPPSLALFLTRYSLAISPSPILSFIPGLSSGPFLLFPQDRSSYFPIPLLHTRNLNYRCPSQSAATHGPTSVSSGSGRTTCWRHYLHT